MCIHPQHFHLSHMQVHILALTSIGLCPAHLDSFTCHTHTGTHIRITKHTPWTLHLLHTQVHMLTAQNTNRAVSRIPGYFPLSHTHTHTYTHRGKHISITKQQIGPKMQTNVQIFLSACMLHLDVLLPFMQIWAPQGAAILVCSLPLKSTKGWLMTYLILSNIRWSCSWHHFYRLLDTKWQHSRSCFHDFQTSTSLNRT